MHEVRARIIRHLGLNGRQLTRRIMPTLRMGLEDRPPQTAIGWRAIVALSSTILRRKPHRGRAKP